MLQFGHKYLAIWTNTFHNLDKYILYCKRGRVCSLIIMARSLTTSLYLLCFFALPHQPVEQSIHHLHQLGVHHLRLLRVHQHYHLASCSSASQFLGVLSTASWARYPSPSPSSIKRLSSLLWKGHAWTLVVCLLGKFIKNPDCLKRCESRQTF